MTQKYIALVLALLLVIGWGIFSRSTARADLPQPEGMFALYEQNRAQGLPNYITEDFILLAYSQVLNEAVTEMEEKFLVGEFTNLVKALIGKLKAKESPTDVDKANLNYLAVIEALLTGHEGSEAAADPKAVQAELKLIREGGGLVHSELMLQQIDYSQFKVRGKYTRSQTLGQYFQAMRYAGTVLFPVLESKATGVTKEQADRLTAQALALTQMITTDTKLHDTYRVFDAKLAWLFGPAEDLTLTDYNEMAGKEKDLVKARAALLELARKNGRQPAIISGAVDVSVLEPGVTAKDVMTGWRFMPQRFTPTSAAFQVLVFDQVGLYSGNKTPFSAAVIQGKQVKGFPLALEIMALLGSKEAEKRLKDNDETNYEGYDQAAARAKKYFEKAEDLPALNLKLCQEWLTSKTGPAETRRLNTALGFWTYQRYINLLYVKQSYTMVSKSVEMRQVRDMACIEPAPELYLGLQKQVQTMMDYLKADSVKKLHELLGVCHEIAVKTAAGKDLDKKDIDFLNDLDKAFFKLIALKDNPIVVDVHTEPNSKKVLEEALGYPLVVTKELKGVQARGALFSYYEFKQPINDRLTDDKWRAMLKDSKQMEALTVSIGSTVKSGLK